MICSNFSLSTFLSINSLRNQLNVQKSAAEADAPTGSSVQASVQPTDELHDQKSDHCDQLSDQDSDEESDEESDQELDHQRTERDQLAGICGLLESLLGTNPCLAPRLHSFVGQLGRVDPPNSRLLAWVTRMFSLAANSDKSFLKNVSNPVCKFFVTSYMKTVSYNQKYFLTIISTVRTFSIFCRFSVLLLCLKAMVFLLTTYRLADPSQRFREAVLEL